MKKIIAVILCLLVIGIPVSADIAYEPPYTSFFEKHQDETVRVERNYYTNGAKGYIALREAPDNNIMRYITNAKQVHVYCSYFDWAMITHLDGVELETPGWAELSELYLIYDEQSFQEEHAAELSTFKGALTLPEGAEEFYLYDYPGAADPNGYSFFDKAEDISLTKSYTDPEGRLWGRISYYRGIRGKWVCVDEPCAKLAPFGGDPDLALIEAADTPEAERSTQNNEVIDIPDEEIAEAVSSPIIPAEEPPAIVFDPLPWLAVGLVVLAVLVSVILLAVCYQKNRKG